MSEEVKKAVLEKVVDGRIACPVARKLAETLGVPYKDVGDACNELNVRIFTCDLGCF